MTAIVDPLLKAKEVADFLRVSVPTLYRRMADGTLPKPVKLGNTSRWPQSEILAAVESGVALMPVP
jgi:excisionase family DNA binding protein